NNGSAQKICWNVTDNAGNTSGTTCDGTTYKVDGAAPSHTGVTVASSTAGSNGWYKALSKKVTLSDGHSGVASAKYCFTTGSSCTPGTAAAISSNAFTATFGGNASAQKLCWNITDNAGNTSGTACDGTTYKVDTESPRIGYAINWSTTTTGVNGWYKALGIKSSVADNHSGISSVKYCITTGSTCTPGTTATLSSNAFILNLESNASAQKICSQMTDNAGNTSSVQCSEAYKVDKVDPTVSMSLKMNGRTITMTVTSATDAHSKIAGYEYTFKSADYTGSSGWITSQNYTTTVQYGGTYDYFCVTVKDNAGRTSQNCKRGVEVAG
ncbi:MAG: hypothetical protein HFH86_01860, partial [Bacilli bacterium]|nr:hypothetical protein [Bacilli bacterium]